MLNRNFMIYYRNRGTVFFSLLGVIVIIGLYVLFLGNTVATQVSEMDGGSFVMDSWVMGGLIAAATITTILGAYAVMVDDEANKIYKDFYSSPIPRSKITMGYLLNGVLVGTIMSVLTFVLAEAFIWINGGELLSFIDMMRCLGIILVTVLSSSSLVCLLVSFIHTNAAYSSCSIVMGTLVGFLVGAYIPIGQLPSGVQTVIHFFPTSHAAVLLRKIMMPQAIEAVMSSAPPEYVVQFKKEMGVVFFYGDTEATAWFHILFLLGSALLFYLLAIWHMSRISRKK